MARLSPPWLKKVGGFTRPSRGVHQTFPGGSPDLPGKGLRSGMEDRVGCGDGFVRGVLV